MSIKELMTAKQMKKAIELQEALEGEIRVLIVHDTGIHMNIINTDAEVKTIDVDYDFHPHVSALKVPGEHIMDKLR